MPDESTGGGPPIATEDAPSPPPAPASPPPPPLVPAPERAVMLRVTLALFVIGSGVWLLLAGSAHRRNYSAAGSAWHRGAQNYVEITLVREDRTNLSCAANPVTAGLHCGFDANHQPHPANAGDDDQHILRPYNTVNGELILGAGLWDSPALRPPLPAQRFTVYCDYDIVGAWRTVALRWSPVGAFGPPDRSVTVGTLRDCAIPQ